MMLLDGGKIVDYSAEPGYFTVDNSSMPSMFSGSLEEALASSFDRFRYGGASPVAQKVLYINLQEIKGIRFGTRSPINYFARFYNAELFLRAHGTYSVRITDPSGSTERFSPKIRIRWRSARSMSSSFLNFWMPCRQPLTGCRRMG